MQEPDYEKSQTVVHRVRYIFFFLFILFNCNNICGGLVVARRGNENTGSFSFTSFLFLWKDREIAVA